MNICKLKNNDVIYLENNTTINYNVDTFTTLQLKDILRKCRYIKRYNKTIYEKTRCFNLRHLKENDLIYLFNNDIYCYNNKIDIKKFKEDIKCIERKGIKIAYRKHKQLSLLFNNRYNYLKKERES